MADERETDLIDISDVAAEFDEATETEDQTDVAGRVESFEKLGSPRHIPSDIASLKDRFTAFLFDGFFFYLLYWTALPLYRTIAFGKAAGPIPVGGLHGSIFHGLFLLVTLIILILCEGIFFATPGKFFCGLRLVSKEGERPGFTAALVRNLFKPIDFFLSLFFVGLVIIEKTTWRQRLGDLLAKTVVIKVQKEHGGAISLRQSMLGSTSARLAGGMIDLTLLSFFAYGYALLLNPETPLVSRWLVILAPLALFAFIALPEIFSRTSVGKWIMGLSIREEDGSPPQAGSITVRTLFRPVDLTPFGPLSLLFSERRQRSGDAAAGTVVIREKRRWRVFFGLLLLPLLTAAFVSAGLENRDSFLSPSFRVNFLPSVLVASGEPAELRDVPSVLSLQRFRFQTSPTSEEQSPPIFRPGETVHLSFDVTGYTRLQKEAWISEDLIVRYPDHAVALTLENVIEFRQMVKKAGPIAFRNRVALPPNAQLGRYSVTFTLHDRHSKRQLKEQRFFYVSPPQQ